MTRLAEKGSGRLSTLLVIGLLALAGYAAWQIVPIYYNHYDLVDKVNEICRTPRYKVHGDDDIVRMLMTEVNRRGLGQWIGPESFQITSTENSRQIRLYYERSATILPNVKHTFRFDFTADQPLL